jgi:hypothetical protein
MPDRRDDRQLRLSLTPRQVGPPSNVDATRKNNTVTDLGQVRSLKHGTTVLQRVIREGFTRPAKK